MRLLLDTQIALWWLTGSPRLKPLGRSLIAGASFCAVSVASVWEVDLKHRIGKLPVGPREFRDELRAAGFAILSISDGHVLAPPEGAQTHRDPFDRLLLAVALAERLQLLTADSALIELSREASALPVWPL